MTVYDRTFNLPVVFTPQTFSSNLADVLAAHGRTNLRLAETEKYAHVTYFFNCGREEPYPGEDRILVPSQKVATYDLMPEMSAPGIADKLVADLTSRRHQVVICNFANADMVGHTGNIEATVTAVETLDGCLGRIVTALRSAGGTAIVTADHGNAEQMWDDELKAPHTAHTSNPVPVILCSDAFVGRRLKDGWLRDVAPTMLDLLDIPLAPEMTGPVADREVGRKPTPPKKERPARERGPFCFASLRTSTSNFYFELPTSSFRTSPFKRQTSDFLQLLDFLLLRLVRRDAQRAQKTAVVGADLERAPLATGGFLRRPDLGERARGGAVDESDHGLERDAHLETGGADPLATRFDSRIFCDGGSNGVG